MGEDMIDLIRKQSDYLENVEWRFEEMLELIKIIPQDLKEKLRITYYGFGLLEIKYDFDLNKLINIPNNFEKENDIFFSGSISTSPNRRILLEFVEKEFKNFKKKILINKN